MSDIARNVKIEGEAARSLLANIRDVIGDDDEMAMTAIEGETELKECISEAVDRISELNSHCEALDLRIKDLSERRARFDVQAERIKTAVFAAMGQAEIRKLELPQATLSVRADRPKAEIVDEALVPSKFWKAKDPVLDKKAVLEALKAKEDVPGAALSNGGETLSIRRK